MHYQRNCNFFCCYNCDFNYYHHPLLLLLLILHSSDHYSYYYHYTYYCSSDYIILLPHTHAHTICARLIHPMQLVHYMY